MQEGGPAGMRGRPVFLPAILFCNNANSGLIAAYYSVIFGSETHLVENNRLYGVIKWRGGLAPQPGSNKSTNA